MNGISALTGITRELSSLPAFHHVRIPWEVGHLKPKRGLSPAFHHAGTLLRNFRTMRHKFLWFISHSAYKYINNLMPLQETEFVIKNLSTKKTPDTDIFIGNLTKHLRKRKHQFFMSSSEKQKMRECLPIYLIRPLWLSYQNLTKKN